MNGQQIFNVQNPGSKAFEVELHESAVELNPEMQGSMRQVSGAAKESHLPGAHIAHISFKSMQSPSAKLTSISQVNPVQTMHGQTQQNQLYEVNYPATEGHEHASFEAGPDYIDATNVSEETLRQLLRTNRPLRFDWENKWLRGDQYAHMLNNIDLYRDVFGMHKLAEKQHPENIYLEPLSKLLARFSQYFYLPDLPLKRESRRRPIKELVNFNC